MEDSRKGTIVLGAVDTGNVKQVIMFEAPAMTASQQLSVLEGAVQRKISSGLLPLVSSSGSYKAFPYTNKDSNNPARVRINLDFKQIESEGVVTQSFSRETRDTDSVSLVLIAVLEGSDRSSTHVSVLKSVSETTGECKYILWKKV